MLKVAEAQSDISMPWFVEVHHPEVAYERSFQTWRDAQKFASSILFLKHSSANEFWRVVDVYVRGARFSIN